MSSMTPIELPKFKDWTIDLKLRQFRKVDMDKPSIQFVEFDSLEGDELFNEIIKGLDKRKMEDRKLLFALANAFINKN